MEAADILIHAIADANSPATKRIKVPSEIGEMIYSIANCKSNRALARLVLACALAKAENSQLDAREPYTEIRSGRSFSGRSYDERYIGPLLLEHNLPLNHTTAFLTPTLRNINQPLSSSSSFEGRPRQVYQQAAKVLEAIEQQQVRASEVLIALLAELLAIRDKQTKALSEALATSKATKHSLNSEEIITLLQQHLASRNSSRLPVLLVAALYQTLGQLVGEEIRPLQSHNAADLQTGSLGDIEIWQHSSGRVISAYEIKARAVSLNDLQQAASKIRLAAQQSEVEQIDNYLLVTTHPTEREVSEYASQLSEQLGIEFAVLDALSFARYLLHFFHRARLTFLDEYQNLVLAEADSAVRPELKLAWLALRQAAQS